MSVQPTDQTNSSTPTGLEIAVIGMSGRFPGAGSVEEFWENLKNGVESIGFFSDEELIENGVSPELVTLPDYVKTKGHLENIENFDASFFDYVPREAERIDPQARILHECVWEALENAGYVPDEYSGLIGLYAGNSINLDWLNLLTGGGNGSLFQTEAIVVNFREYLCQRVSYKFNLRGPSINVNTACSTSLTAVHLACQGLLNGECNMAVAGAVTVSLPKKNGYLYHEGIILSPDGHCRAFDADSAGTVFGNGAGVVVLKTLDEAITDRDTVYGVIKGSASNNDGAQKIGFTAPGVIGQAAVIKAALYMAEVDPETIAYIETHGTGTRLGDTIEIEALTRAFGTDKKEFCPIGSVKTNVGHLETASGITGLIKTILALKYKAIPPTLHYQAPNPEIDFKNTPFYVNTGLTPLKRNGYPLRAGVSSFGIGSANVHVVVEEPPEPPRPMPGREYQLIAFSAKTPGALEQMKENLARYFKRIMADPAVGDKGSALADAAYTLKIGRRAFPYRGMFVCPRIEEAVDILSYRDTGNSDKSSSTHKAFHTFQAGKKEMKAVFMFDGLESQYIDMGRDLYDTENVFRREADRCFGIIKPLLGYDIKEILYPHHGSAHSQPAAPGKMDLVEIAQLSIFILEYALARLVMSWGIKPAAMIGYSFGEYTAACIAGVMSPEDTLKLIVARGRLIMQTSLGAMLSVPLPVEQLKSLMDDDLSIAIDNGTSCIVAGSLHAVERFEKQMKQRSLICIRLKAKYALHSKLMEPIVPKFLDVVKSIKLNAPLVPYISNVTGTWITAQEAVDPAYWCRQIRQTARFSGGLDLLSKQAGCIFLEIGPGRDLSVMIGRRMDSDLNQKTVNLLRPQQKKVSDVCYLLGRLGWLWLYGLTVGWGAFYSTETRNRIALPTYPFQREYYWPEVNDNPLRPGKPATGEEPFQGKKSDIGDWFYIPSWKRSGIPARKIGEAAEPLNWLLFIDNCNIGVQLADRLTQGGHDAIIVKAGTGFTEVGEKEYTVNPRQEEDYESLIKACGEKGKFPIGIVHLWNVTGTGKGNMQDQGFYSLLYLARALGNRAPEAKIELMVLTDHMQDVTGGDMLYPEKSTVLGAALTISREYKNVKCRCIDIIIDGIQSETGSRCSEKLIDQLFKELSAASEDEIIAYRNNYRWVKTYQPNRLEAPSGEIPRLKKGGVYLITGGLGGMGLVLAKYLAETVNAKLILTGRSPFPPRAEWTDWVLSNDPDSDICVKIKKLQELEDLGSEVMILSADVTHEEQMKKTIDLAEEKFGKIDGVIHAAGLSGGGLIQGKAQETVESVLAPKVKGTLVLDALFREKELDFFILCSSIISEVPIAGQVVYCAANTFLNHFAGFKAAAGNTFTVSIGWDVWQEVGNVVDALKRSAGSRQSAIQHELKFPHPFLLTPQKSMQKKQAFETRSLEKENPRVVEGGWGHRPLLDRYEIYDSNQAVFISRFSINNLWVLDEHRVVGNAVMPGTGYLELVRAALENYPGYGVVEMGEVFFLSPLTVKIDEEKEVRTIIKQIGGGLNRYTFSVISRLNPEEDQWVEHSRGKVSITSTDQEKIVNYDIKEIGSQCLEKEAVFDHPEPLWSDRGGISWGPRWDNCKSIKFGDRRCMGVLELPGVFAEDVQSYKLHPALLDVATSIMLGQDRYHGNFLPFFYKRLRITGNLPPKVVCFARAGDDDGDISEKETLKFDITIMDEWGKELVDIEEFMLKKVDTGKVATGISPLSRTFSSFLSAPTGKMGTYTMESVKSAMQFSILPSEGVDVFRRILSGETPPHILVSTGNLEWRLEQGRGFAERLDQLLLEKGAGAARHSRPELRSVYAAPRTPIEKKMVEIFEELLGVDTLGIDDDFFELGGDSLIAVSFAARIHKELNLKIDISEFFKKPSVRELANWAEGGEGTSEEFLPIESAEKKEYYILSSAQKRMFTLQQFNQGLISYNENFTVFIEGKLDTSHLEHVFYRLIRRHENLRTSFRMIGEQPVQKIHDEVKFQVEYYDMGEGEIEIPAKPDLAIELLMKDFIRPFDLSLGPLFRVGLKKLQDNRYLLLMDMHHIITDLLSQAILFSDFVRLYQGNELEEPRIHYKDYCEWIITEHREEEIKKQGVYWLNEFQTEVPLLNLPTDYPRPSIQSVEGDTCTFTLDKEDTDKIRKLAARHEVTLYMVMLGLINVLMSKLSGNEDIAIGTASSGRNHADLHNMVGMFINVLCMRNFPSREKSFSDFLTEIKGRVLQASQNQDYQFETLVEKLSVRRDPARHPLFDVGLELQGNEWAMAASGDSAVKVSNVTMKPYFYKNKISRVDLLFFVKDLVEHLEFEVEYCTRLFKEDTIHNFMNYFKNILAVVSEDPGEKIGKIGIIPAEEIQEMIDRIQDKNKDMDIEFNLNFE